LEKHAKYQSATISLEGLGSGLIFNQLAELLLKDQTN